MLQEFLYTFTDPGDNDFQAYNVSGNSFTPDHALADGGYWAQLEFIGLQVQVPMTFHLVSGPDLGTIGASVFDDYFSTADFTVAVPEPATAGLAIAFAHLASPRRHRRAPQSH